MTSDFDIPDKLYYKIGEVAKITGVKAYVLRYWESEFRLIRPAKSRAGQRLYQRKDIEVLLQIRRLLYDEKYTIPGAKKQLRAMRGPEGKQQLALEFDESGEPIEGALDVEAAEVVVDDEGADAGAENDDLPVDDDEAEHDDDVRSGPARVQETPTLAGLSVDRGLPAEVVSPLILDDPTSMALIDQALREANAILALVEEDAAVR